VKGKLAILLMVLWLTMTGCEAEQGMRDITQVTFTTDAGTILPELQWHEQYVITRDKVVFARHGQTDDTEVHTGTWEIPVMTEAVAALFATLEAVNPAEIRRIEPEDAPDGGENKGYTVAYGRGKTLSLLYDPGTTYAGGEQIVAPVQAFLESLSLPAEAANRYTFEP
jgi:hypothetical protein